MNTGSLTHFSSQIGLGQRSGQGHPYADCKWSPVEKAFMHNIGPQNNIVTAFLNHIVREYNYNFHGRSRNTTWGEHVNSK